MLSRDWEYSHSSIQRTIPQGFMSLLGYVFSSEAFNGSHQAAYNVIRGCLLCYEMHSDWITVLAHRENKFITKNTHPNVLYISICEENIQCIICMNIYTTLNTWNLFPMCLFKFSDRNIKSVFIITIKNNCRLTSCLRSVT